MFPFDDVIMPVFLDITFKTPQMSLWNLQRSSKSPTNYRRQSIFCASCTTVYVTRRAAGLYQGCKLNHRSWEIRLQFLLINFKLIPKVDIWSIRCKITNRRMPQGPTDDQSQLIQAPDWCRLAHYSDVIMIAIASQITSLTIVYSTVYSVAGQRKYQSSASLAFVRGFLRGPVNSPHKWPVTRKMFPFDDVIMASHCMSQSQPSPMSPCVVTRPEWVNQ